MIVRNEAARLGHCLDSVRPLVDEMVIVDTGSTDGTRELARSRGAKVLDFPWQDDFSAARNEGLRHCPGDWLLVLDADEAIDAQDHDRIREAINQERIPAYRLILRNYQLGGGETVQGAAAQVNDTTYSEGSQFSHYADGRAVRLCRRLPDLGFRGRIHELLEPYFVERNLPVQDSPVVVHHFGKADREREAQKRTYYFQLTRQRAREAPEDAEAQFHLLQQAMVIEDWPTALSAALACLVHLDRRTIHPLVLLGAAMGLQFAQRHAEALPYLEELLDRWPDHAQGLARRAVSQAALGRLEEARRSLQAAIRSQPGFIVPYVNLAELEGQGGRYDAARAALAAGLAVCPKDPQLLHALIQLGTSHGDLDRAVQDAWTAIQRCPEGGQGAWHRLVAIHLFQQGARTRALEVLELGLAAFPGHEDLLRLRALVEGPSSI